MEYLFLAILFILGACIGSFLHATSFRIAHKQDPIKGRSACPKCRKQLNWYDMVPLLSYLLLRGKCRFCQWQIQSRYFFVELIVALLFLSTGLYWLSQGASTLVLVRDLFIVSVLFFLFLHDLLYYILPDIVTIPSILIIGVFQLVLGVSWQGLVLAILIGAGFFAFQFLISKGKWIGGGDIRFGALMGVILGWSHILLGLFMAYILGSVVSLALVAGKQKKFGSMVPFGTFLSLATLITIWFGDAIITWYLGLL